MIMRSPKKFSPSFGSSYRRCRSSWKNTWPWHHRRHNHAPFSHPNSDACDVGDGAWWSDERALHRGVSRLLAFFCLFLGLQLLQPMPSSRERRMRTSSFAYLWETSGSWQRDIYFYSEKFKFQQKKRPRDITKLPSLFAAGGWWPHLVFWVWKSTL